jgi:FkbM family methyltransferase
MIPSILDFIRRKFNRGIEHLAGFWSLWSLAEQHRMQSAKQDEALSRLQTLHAELATQVGTLFWRFDISNTRIDTLSQQVDQVNIRLQRLESDLSRTVAAETDRLDGYLVYHAGALSRQLGELNRVFYVQPKLDALFVGPDFDLLIPTVEAGLLSDIARRGIAAIEPGVRAVLQARVHAGDTAVDIGAKIGLHALTMARIVGRDGRVVCVEPSPHTASALERTLRLNGFSDWTEVICSSAADSAGEAKLNRAQHSSTSSLFPIPEGSDSIAVRTISLDSRFAPGARVDIVKIDAKGAEPLVYKGMSRVIRDNPEIKLILAWSASHFIRSDQYPDSFWELIRRDGFKVQLIDDRQPGRLVSISETDAIPDVANILLTRK